MLNMFMFRLKTRLITVALYFDTYSGGDIVKLGVFSLLVYFTVCLTVFCVNALNSPYRQFYPLTLSKRMTKYSVSFQVLTFDSILPISLQQIEYEKHHAVHSNELAKSYKMKPISIFIDTLKYDLWEFNKNRPFFTVFCQYLFKKSHIKK